MRRGMLLLEDGAFFKGELFGASDPVFGEAVFNTAFAGYEEVLTDPSYAGQIVVMASPHIGNYGITVEDMESSRCHLRGFVVREASPLFSSWRAKESLSFFLERQGVCGLSGADTRAIVKHLREKGAMRAAVAAAASDADRETLLEKVRRSPPMIGRNFLREVSPRAPARHEGEGPRVVLFDYGMKKNILRNLLKEGFDVIVLPGFAEPEQTLSYAPEAIVLSNGPGDPAALSEVVENLKRLMRSEIPILGICLGHQLLGRALGAATYKLKFGHRGVNHPVKNLETGKVLITSHNHGFAVDPESLPANTVVTHQNLYDQTLEGFRHTEFPFIAVQFHPEAAPGPEDAAGIFAEFKRLVTETN